MVALAIGLGIYGYLILALGLLGWLYKLPVFLAALPFLVGGGVWLAKRFYQKKISFGEIKKDKLAAFSVLILLLQVFINFLGAISPELSFDALWYHLTAAKLYVLNHQIFYIPGWLLLPANLPRLGDMFYVSALLFSDEILAKLLHFAFGILSTIALFNLLKRYFNLRISLLGVITFYTMLIVGWQSSTAYVDLTRLFFEILALDLFLQYVEKKKESFLWESAILVGLASSTKIIAFGSLLVFLILILVARRRNIIRQVSIYFLLALAVASPWLIQSQINYGNPLFPFFGSSRETSFSIPADAFFSFRFSNLFQFPFFLWNATFNQDNFISPVFLLFAPLVLLSIWHQKPIFKITALYVLIGAIFAPLFSNRYLLPYLPGLTLVTLSIINWKWARQKQVEKLIIFVILFSAFLNLGSRALATGKFLPYLSGSQSKNEFLSRNLNFSFGDFYDVDGFFQRNIKEEDLVLIYGIHNLYYVDFPYIHESWAKPGTYFTHILVGNNQDLPEKFGKRLLVYQNKKTGVKLYIYGDKYQ